MLWFSPQHEDSMIRGFSHKFGFPLPKCERFVTPPCAHKNVPVCLRARAVAKFVGSSFHHHAKVRSFSKKGLIH